jgi:hypothetical protein
MSVADTRTAQSLGPRPIRGSGQRPGHHKRPIARVFAPIRMSARARRRFRAVLSCPYDSLGFAVPGRGHSGRQEPREERVCDISPSEDLARYAEGLRKPIYRNDTRPRARPPLQGSRTPSFASSRVAAEPCEIVGSTGPCPQLALSRSGGVRSRMSAVGAIRTLTAHVPASRPSLMTQVGHCTLELWLGSHFDRFRVFPDDNEP